MSIQDLGAIGEVIGALAVVVTLIYLSVQTRRLRLTGERSITAEVAQAHSRWRSALYENPELAELVARDNAGVELSEAEQLQLRYLHFDLFIASIMGHYTQEKDSPRAEIDYLLDILAQNPSVLRSWQEHAHLVNQMAPGLTKTINARLPGTESASNNV